MRLKVDAIEKGGGGKLGFLFLLSLPFFFIKKKKKGGGRGRCDQPNLQKGNWVFLNTNSGGLIFFFLRYSEAKPASHHQTPHFGNFIDKITTKQNF